MTGKKLFATIFVLVALVVWGATTPKVTVAQDRLQTRLQDPASCSLTPIQDQIRDRLHTPTATVVTSAQLQQTAAPTAAVTATLPLQTRTPSVLHTRQQSKDQIHLSTPIGVGRR